MTITGYPPGVASQPAGEQAVGISGTQSMKRKERVYLPDGKLDDIYPHRFPAV